MEEPKSDTGISFLIKKKDPKPNAPEYTVSTIQELFEMLNAENMDRFLDEFPTLVRSAIHMRDAVKAVAESMGEPIENKDFPIPSITWIDD